MTYGDLEQVMNFKIRVPTANDDFQSFKNLVDALVENNNTCFLIKLDKKI